MIVAKSSNQNVEVHQVSANGFEVRANGKSQSFDSGNCQENMDAAMNEMKHQEASDFDYDPDCPACLRHLRHSNSEHESALRRNYEASRPEYSHLYNDW